MRNLCTSPCPCLPRKAAESLSQEKAVPKLVLDSLPFGSDNVETQVLHHSETEHLAKEFAEMETPEPVPTVPTAIWLCKFSLVSTIHCAPSFIKLVTHPTHHHSSDLFLLVFCSSLQPAGIEEGSAWAQGRSGGG